MRKSYRTFLSSEKLIFIVLLIFSINSFSKSKECNVKKHGFDMIQKYSDKIFSKYELKLQNKQTANIILRNFNGKEGNDANGKKFYLSGNCFSFATNQERNIPASNISDEKSPVSFPYMVNRTNLLKSMEMEQAIFLGKDLSKIKTNLNINSKKDYYLVAVFLKREEYHFWGLFQSGWWNKPSQVGMISKGDENIFCPTSSSLRILNKNSHGRPYTDVGYFLFPVR